MMDRSPEDYKDRTAVGARETTDANGTSHANGRVNPKNQI